MSPRILPLVMGVLAGGLALPALGQTGPTLSTMPPPPSAADPKPKEGGRSAARPAPRAKAKPAEASSLAVPATARVRRTEPPAETASRPKRFVPEEFDRDGSDDGNRAKPFMSQSGRPGMGMRF